MKTSKVLTFPTVLSRIVPLKNHAERIECRPFEFRATAKCFKSFLYLLLSPPFGEEMFTTEKLPLGSLLYVQNDLSFCILSR